MRLHAVLDTDPHFRYGISFDPQPPELRPEPGLLAAQQETMQDGRTLTFKIFARSAQSLDERQIPLELMFNFEGSLTLDGQEHRLGNTEDVALSAAVASIDSDKVTVVPHLNNTVHTRHLPPGPDTEEALAEGKLRLRYRRLPDD